MVVLRCSVRGCGHPLERDGKLLRCDQGHAFDVARSGYVNLLQPQDRRSRLPGDPPEVQAARSRFLERGLEAPLVEALREIVEIHGARAAAGPLALLDVGCGDGFFLRALCSALGEGRGIEAHGVDISTAAVDAAARVQPGATFVVANADRVLPYSDESFDVVTSVNARLNPSEFHRILRGGVLVVVVPAHDDLIELRAAVLGEAGERERMPRLREELARGFEFGGAIGVRHVVPMDVDAVRDALALSYRGARRSQQPRVEGLGAMDVTIAHDIGWWRKSLS